MIQKLKKGDKNFVQIPNSIARDKKLSNKAKGLLLTILSMSDSFVINKTKLHLFSCDSKNGVIAQFDELLAAGYITEIKGRQLATRNGRKYYGNHYTVHTTRQENAVPNLGNPNRVTQNRDVDNTVLRNTEVDNKEINHTHAGTSFFSTVEDKGSTNRKDIDSKKQKTSAAANARANRNMKPKYTDTLQTRQSRFVDEINRHYGRVGLTQEQAQAFLDYFTQKTADGTQMAFETKQYWDTEKRLKIWLNQQYPTKDWDNDY